MIPSELIKLCQWVSWRLADRGGKSTKIPYCCTTGGPAKSNDPTTWSTYQEAINALDTGKYSGIGFVFSHDDPYVGIDVDSCRNPITGTIEPWAAEYLSLLDSYTEVSQSGAGVHVIVRGNLKSGGRRRKGGTEAYAEGRYFCVTGQLVDGYSPNIESRQAELEKFEARAFGIQPEIVSPQDHPAYELADDELIDKARHAHNGGLFERLYAGQWQGAYSSQSEADLALLNLLAWWSGRDPAQMDRLFRRSGLMRPKVETHPDYLRMTIDKAIAGTSTCYDPRRRIEPPVQTAPVPASTAVVERDDGQKEKISSIVRRIDHEHQLIYDERNQAVYEYNGQFWLPISLDTLKRYAMEQDSREHTSTKRRNEIADQMLRLHSHREINWRNIQMTDIPVRNGVVDIRDGSIRPHRKDDFLETVVPHDYVPGQECQKWHKSILEWFANDHDQSLKIRLLQEFFGYILMPHARYKRALFMYGPSDTGKSQVLGVMLAMVGVGNYTSIGVHEMDDPRKLAPIKGKMLNQMSEISENALLADSGFKRLVSVEEPVRIDPKWGHVIDYVPFAKHVVCTNNLPRIRDYTSATFNRISIIKFNNVIPDELQDPLILDKIVEEMPGILAWAIRGAEQLWRRRGEWTIVPESEKELKEYRVEQNDILSFIDDKTIPTNEWIDMEAFRTKYREYDPVSRLNNTQITQMLKKSGCQVGHRRDKGGRSVRALLGRSWA